MEPECPQVCAARNLVKNPAALEETQEPRSFSTSLARGQGAGAGRSFPTGRARAQGPGRGGASSPARGGAERPHLPRPGRDCRGGAGRSSPLPALPASLYCAWHAAYLPPSNRPGGSAALNQGGGAETGPGLLANSRTRYRAGGGRLVRSGDQFLLALTPIPSPQGRAFIVAATLRRPRPPRAPFT